MKFVIEQVALFPPNPERAIAFLQKIGAAEWARDHVVAKGFVFESAGQNEADLAFNYDMLGDAKELEVLHYTEGYHWMRNYAPSVSHLGMHVTPAELLQWRDFMSAENISVAQEVFTESHTNPVIAGKRWYQYVIFDTREILGTDLKFIVRCDHAPINS